MSEEARGAAGREAQPTESESMQRLDRRYDVSDLRSWAILAIMVLLFVSYALALYLLEPGIR